MARQQSRFEQWAWSPIAAYRLGLTLGYIAVVYFGVSAIVAGVPVFTITAPEGWTPIWASALVLGGIIATFGSVSSSKRFELTETVGAWLLFLTLASYSGSLLWVAYGLTGEVPDSNRAAAGAGFVALGVQPFIRMLWLMAQLGRKSSTTRGH